MNDQSEIERLRAELEDANTAIINLTAEWHRAEIALDRARRELVAWRDANVVDTRRSIKRALSARRVARYARRLTAERDAARAEAAKAKAEVRELRAALRGQSAPAQTEPAGLYGKYRISKADGSPTNPEAEYFVLRIDTDPAARAALNVYADYITFSAPEFCDDLRKWLASVPLKPAPATGQE